MALEFRTAAVFRSSLSMNATMTYTFWRTSYLEVLKINVEGLAGARRRRPSATLPNLCASLEPSAQGRLKLTLSL